MASVSNFTSSCSVQPHLNSSDLGSPECPPEIFICHRINSTNFVPKKSVKTKPKLSGVRVCVSRVTDTPKTEREGGGGARLPRHTHWMRMPLSGLYSRFLYLEEETLMAMAHTSYSIPPASKPFHDLERIRPGLAAWGGGGSCTGSTMTPNLQLLLAPGTLF